MTVPDRALLVVEPAASGGAKRRGETAWELSFASRVGEGMMNKTLIPLEVIEITTPCSASWDKMRGNDRVRFCEECKLHVYDLSAMSREAATELVSQREGRMCVQMVRRHDGTVITDDCGPLRKTARRAVNFAGAAASVVLCAALSPLFLLGSDQPTARTTRASFMPMAMFQSWIAPLTRWWPINRVRGAMPVAIGGGIAPPTTWPTLGAMEAPTTAPSTQPATQPVRE